MKDALESYYQGENAERNRELEQARDLYTQSIETSPRPRAYYRLAEVQRALGDIPSARSSAQAALQLAPTYAQARRLLEVLESESPQASPGVLQPTPEDEVDGFAIVQDPTRPIQSSVPATDIITTQPDVSATGSSAPPLPPEAESLLSEARQAATDGDWERSRALSDRVLSEYGEHPQVYHTRGYALVQLGRLAEAEQDFRQAINLDSDFADAYNDLGVTLEKIGRSGEAVQAYERAIAVGNHPDSLYNLALLREKMGDYRDSIDLYERYIRYDSVSAYANFARERITKLRRNAF
ncbi:MAG: tetratricopeptide repeat protein [bacterium]